ncbi:MAG: isoprenylcysteine carboxylmethyltransferase family protein [Clostridiales bacterium]|nr:isoprenylcysteine carboxylmethyltransferase family protein [Clostridiales bacterium]
MTKKLFAEAVSKFLLGVVLVGVLVFLPAGSFDYLQGWLLVGVLFVPMLVAGIVMMAKNPYLLKSRLDAKEKQGKQQLVIKLSGLMFVAGFVLAGFNYRFGWYTLPLWISVVGAVVFLLGYVMLAFVFKQNTFLARTIKVEKNQTVVDTGLYGIVRHPMYSATLLLFLSMPIILGSLYALVVFLAYPFIIAMRIKNEETLLENELAGYSEYKQKVKYRLIPFIW